MGKDDEASLQQLREIYEAVKAACGTDYEQMASFRFCDGLVSEADAFKFAVVSKEVTYIHSYIRALQFKQKY